MPNIMFFMLLLMTSCSSITKIASKCSTPKIIDETGWGLNDHDRQVLENVMLTERCAYYDITTPCVKEFHKRGNRHYYVMCGEKNE